MLFTWAHILLQPFAMNCCYHTQKSFLVMVNNQTQKKQTQKTITIVKEARIKFYYCVRIKFHASFVLCVSKAW